MAIDGTIERAKGAAQHLSFVWTETGGPRPSIPSRKGFGSVILLDVAEQWAGNVSADFSGDGLAYSLRIPLDLIEVAPRPADRTAPVAAT